MTDNSAPGVYTQPDGDADDVLGHRAAFDKVRATDDRAFDTLGAADDADDVEGHRVADRAADKALGAADTTPDEGDDVEGHRAAF
ncbi:hypothetical protein ACXR2U_23855 [Jatrophihabitans sp. YIM 134969]